MDCLCECAYANIRTLSLSPSVFACMLTSVLMIAACVCALDRERVFAMLDDGHPGYKHTILNSYTCIERGACMC